MNNPLVFNFILGKRCNMRCDFCYNKMEEYVELTLTDVLSGYRKIKDLDCTLSFIGGEPLVYNWFRACLSLPKPKEVYTNGLLLTSDYLRYNDVIWYVAPHTNELRRKGINIDQYIGKLSVLRDQGMNIELVIIGTDIEALRIAKHCDFKYHVVAEYDNDRHLHGIDNVIKYGPRYSYKGKEITIADAVKIAYTGCRYAFFVYNARSREFLHECKGKPFSIEYYSDIRTNGLSCKAGECWLDCMVFSSEKDNLVVTKT